MMKPLIAFLFPAFLLLNGLNRNPVASVMHREVTDLNEYTKFESTVKIQLDNALAKYDTLIPIFDSLFITYAEIDSAHYDSLSKGITMQDSAMAFYSGGWITRQTKKWGVIDSDGNIVVPFICDGVKAISEDKGVMSVFSFSYSLNTGIPRYHYSGRYFFFAKDGLLNQSEKEFGITVEQVADFHKAEFVIAFGLEFYLPDGFRKSRW
jgi:WG containing repeat